MTVLSTVATMDEPRQVLLFLCVPLSLLLLGTLIYLAMKPSRYIAKFPNFFLKIDSVGQEEAYVVYKDSDRNLSLEAQMKRGRKIAVKIPKTISEQNVKEIVPNLVLALTKLRYSFLIFRPGEPQPVPEQERVAAFDELQRLGFGIQSSNPSEGISNAVTNSFNIPADEDPHRFVSRVQQRCLTPRHFENVSRS